MKKVNILSKAEMKSVMGGLLDATGGGSMCLAWCGGEPENKSVTCNGSSCTATDDVGCTGVDEGGPYERKCPTS